MISDCGSYLGAPEGTYRGTFGESLKAESDRTELTVTKEGYVLSKTGRLSGSSKPSVFGIKNLVEKVGVPLEKVILFSSYNPCKKYGFADKKGSLAVGKDADLVVISDDFDALYTYSEGRLVFDHKIDTDLFDHNFVKNNKID